MASSSTRFVGKTAIVTGGSNGIGKGITKVLVKNGGKVAILDIDDDGGRRVQSAYPDSVTFLHCDMTSEQEIKENVEKVILLFGRLDLLVNNVGIFPAAKGITDVTSDELRKVFEINLMSHFLASKYALPSLRETKGSIVNIASSLNKNPLALSLCYITTKGGVAGLTKSLSMDEAEHGVRVNSISPGPIATNIWDSMDKKFQERLSQTVLMKRPGQPDEIGEAVLFLATGATYVTGADIEVSGGQTTFA